MATDDRADAGAGALQLDAYGLLLRAALLAGHGADAAPLARRLASVVEGGSSRSCLEAGAAVQLTVDAPGDSRLRVGVRIGSDFGKTLDGLVPADAQAHLRDVLAALPPAAHDSLGTWLFWTPARQSIYIDFRDPSPKTAYARISAVLSAAEAKVLEHRRQSMSRARPWALRLESDGRRFRRAHVHWLFDRHASPADFADDVLPGSWPRVVEILSRLLQRPSSSGRWVAATPLDDESPPALRIGSTGWSLVPEDHRKQRGAGELIGALGGARDHAEALWSLCRGAASPEWRVGRACELKVTGDQLRTRLFMVPQLQRATAGISNSEPVTSWGAPSAGVPSSA